MSLTLKSSSKCFGGCVFRYSHNSSAVNTPMTFSVFIPQHEINEKLPVLYWLSGLTCTDENFITKAGAQRSAAKNKIILVAPDTSPRGAGVEGETQSWDFGVGAGFYINSTEEKWAKNYRMYDYIVNELPELVKQNFPASNSASIFGHSMGGHGALTIYIKNHDKYKSVSAFAPICNPSKCAWGEKALTGYIGADQSKWGEYDATELIKHYKGAPLHFLISQGTEDNFLKQHQLLPENFKNTALTNQHHVDLRYDEGYDHSYYYISTFIDDHINYHVNFLRS